MSNSEPREKNEVWNENDALVILEGGGLSISVFQFSMSLRFKIKLIIDILLVVGASFSIGYIMCLDSTYSFKFAASYLIVSLVLLFVANLACDIHNWIFTMNQMNGKVCARYVTDFSEILNQAQSRETVLGPKTSGDSE